MIVTLAGHVDHGKTSLVRALTGVNTDRLEQEQTRGLTIDLGFAYIDDGAIGFVDVPGHHKFIHNMVAGIACHQHALLVIAADDGPMPQSREHLDILSTVGLKSGVVALTKCDQVDEARIEAAQTEVRNLLQGSFLETAEIFHTTTEQPESFEPLLGHLRDRAATFQQADSDAPFRLAIDRAFVITGAGLVVTGTVHSGSIEVDATLHHFPSGQQARVRSIRTQDQERAVAHTGDRCALNISGLGLEDVTRGDWLSTQPAANFRNVSIALGTLVHFPRAIKHWTPVHVYHATSHATGRVALLDSVSIAPGESAIVDLVLDEPLPCYRGDQLVVRDQSLDLTIGGGEVIFAEEQQPTRRRAPMRRNKITAFSSDTWPACVEQLLASGPADLAEVARVWAVPVTDVQREVETNDVTRIGNSAIPSGIWNEWADAALGAIEATQNGLRENQLPKSIPAGFRQPLLNELVQDERAVSTGGLYKLPEQRTEVPEALQSLWSTIEDKLGQKQAPSTGDLAKELKQPQMMLEVKMRELVKLGYLVEIANHRFYLPAQLRAIADDVKALAANGGFSVRDFRDATGIGRNVAIEVLEYFDSRGFTRRQDNERTLLRDEL